MAADRAHDNSLSARAMRVAWSGVVPDDDQHVIADMQQRMDALGEALRAHRCIVDGLMTVGECVDCGRCGCTNGLLLNINGDPEGDVRGILKRDPSEALQSNENTGD